MTKKPVLLIILDGFGYREGGDDNAIANAHKPHWDRWWKQYPHTMLATAEQAVGLPRGQMGNSEVGHLNIGAGRVVHQEFTKVDLAIEDGSLLRNPVLREGLEIAKRTGKAVHLLSLLSDGGVHSHELHVQAIAKAACEYGVESVYLHAFLDGRDTPPQSAKTYIERFEQAGYGRIATLTGRYFAMDRDNRWERVEAAYNALYGQAALTAPTAQEGLAAAYARGETDEFVQATQIGAPVALAEGDVVFFLNFRADRARELTQALMQEDFNGFTRAQRVSLGYFATLTRYADDFPYPVMVEKTLVRNGLGEFLSAQGIAQLRIAETEKYPHVTYFFNGGEETPFAGETRVLVKSPKVATYDLQPAMSAPEVTEKLLAAIASGDYPVMICNYANGDMVGHTGHYAAAVEAIETLDHCLGQVIAAMQAVGGEVLITADHGNAEMMQDPQTGQAHTAHTLNPVPLLYIGRPATLEQGGALQDVAPTLLALMGLTPPSDMTGRCLVRFTA